jgi:hypothetical protein
MMPFRVAMPNSAMKPISDAMDSVPARQEHHHDAADQGQRKVRHDEGGETRRIERHVQQQEDAGDRREREHRDLARRALLRLELPSVLHPVARR